MKQFTVHMVGNHENYQSFEICAGSEKEAILKAFNLCDQIGDDTYSFHSIYAD